MTGVSRWENHSEKITVPLKRKVIIIKNNRFKSTNIHPVRWENWSWTVGQPWENFMEIQFKLNVGQIEFLFFSFLGYHREGLDFFHFHVIVIALMFEVSTIILRECLKHYSLDTKKVKQKKKMWKIHL